jgi:hypothetical protein
MAKVVDYQEKPKKREKTLLEMWVAECVPCEYVEFVKPVKRAPKQEPVYEFKLTAPRIGIDSKYYVDFIGCTEYVLVFILDGETNLVPMSNVNHLRPIRGTLQ